MQMSAYPQLSSVAKGLLNACMDHAAGVGRPKVNDLECLPERMTRAIEKTRAIFGETQSVLDRLASDGKQVIPLSEGERQSIQAFFTKTSTAINLLHEELKRRAEGASGESVNIEKLLSQYARERHELIRVLNGAARLRRDVSAEQTRAAGQMAVPVDNEITSSGEVSESIRLRQRAENEKSIKKRATHELQKSLVPEGAHDLKKEKEEETK